MTARQLLNYDTVNDTKQNNTKQFQFLLMWRVLVHTYMLCMTLRTPFMW